MGLPENNEMSGIITAPGQPALRGKGYFTIGTTAAFIFEFPDITGSRYDPSLITATITAPNNQIVATITELDKLEIGKYGILWPIPYDAATGVYIITLNYIAETTTGPETLSLQEAFVVGTSQQKIISPRLVGARGLLESFVGVGQRIPIYNEIGRFNRNRTQAEFTFDKWNQPSRVKVYINGDPSEIGYQVDYINGKILFDHPLTSIDEVTANYTFRWFEDEELHMFIQEGIQYFNQWAPHSVYTISDIPNRYIVTACMQAAVFAIRRLIMDLMFQEPEKVFGGAEAATRKMTQLDAEKKDYEQQLKDLYGEKAKGPYVGLTRTITTPSFTLPGGRSRWFRYLFSQG